MAGIAGIGTKQIMRVMKLTAFILLVACLQVSAGANSQSLTLSLKGATLEKVFDEIKKQSGYYFLYEEGLLNRARKVDIEVKDASIKQVLDTCFINQPLTYKIVNKIVVVKNKEFKDLNAIDQDPIDVKGRVTDKDGNPLSGANVKIKGSNIGTTTDQNGNYELKGIDENAVLEISYVGYDVHVVAVKKQKTIDASLEVLVKELDATIIKGYYTTTRRLNTGNVSKVTAKDISKQPVANPLATLEGRVPGLYIAQQTGVPGSGFLVRLRGQNSISNGNEPLYIIDGVPFPSTPIGATSLNNFITVGGSPLSSINPSDIESIEVLKDADATAIYGSRGANGVILITTKKGKAGKTKVDFNIYTGIGKVSRKMDLLNTEQYLEMRREAFVNDKVSPSGPGATDLLLWDSTRFTDWQEELIGGTANITDAQASVSGGNTNTQFLIGGGYRRETTVFPGDFANQKASAHVSLSHKSLNEKFRTTFSASYMLDKNNLFQEDITARALIIAPNAPPGYDSLGQINWQQQYFSNPYSLMLRKYKANTNNLVTNSILEYQLIKGLKLKTSLGYTQTYIDETVINPISSFYPGFNVQTGSSQFGNSSIKTWIVEPQIIWDPKIRDGQLSFLIGTSFQQDTREGEIIQASGYINDALLENINGAASISKDAFSPPYSIKYKYNSVFGRINYSYKEKYIINLTGRRDGSSRFGPGKQFANFGAIGAAWIFSKEDFIDNNIHFLSYGKFRASYGLTGNDQLTDYQFLDTYSPTAYSYLGSSAIFPTRLYNPDFAWETNKKIEAALELGLWNDRILFTVNYYRNRSSNQLVGYPLPLITGGSSIQSNLPATIQNTGWEFEISTSNIKSKNINWTTALNISIPRNKLISYPNLENSTFANRYVIGKSLFLQKKFHYTGVDPQTGLYTFEDVDMSGTISTPNDLMDLKEVKQDYFGGFRNTVQYRSWEIDIFFQFVKQTGINYLRSLFGAPGQLSNQPDIVLSRWNKPGDITDIQKYTQAFGPVYTQYDISQRLGDHVISDASFIRLKNVQISYQIPTKLVNKVHMQAGNIYVQGANLFTITNYLGMDPEIQRNNNLPLLRVVSAGIKITL